VGFEPKISAGERPQAARLLRSWVRIPPGAWIFVCCECRVLSGRGLCDELITRPEESYRLCCVVVYDLETSRIGAPYIYDISSLRVNLAKATKTPQLFLHPPGDKLGLRPPNKHPDTESSLSLGTMRPIYRTGVAFYIFFQQI